MPPTSEPPALRDQTLLARTLPIIGRGIHLLTGIIEAEFGHAALTVERAEKVPYKADPWYAA